MVYLTGVEGVGVGVGGRGWGATMSPVHIKVMPMSHVSIAYLIMAMPHVEFNQEPCHS